MITERFTESMPIAGAVAATSTIGSWFTDAVPLSGEQGRRFRALVMVPTLTNSATVDFSLYWSATSGGTYAQLAGSSIATESTGNKLFEVEFTTDGVLNTQSTAQFVKGYLKMNAGASTATPSVIIEGKDAAHKPTTDNASIAQTALQVYSL